MEHLQQYWLLYAISNLVAIIILVVTWKSSRLGRLLFVLLFGWASWMNSTTALHTPEKYLEYADMSIPFYGKIILGWFSKHIPPIILMIAAGQFFISIGMLLKGVWVRLACIGAIIFLAAIAPLGVGSGFPFSLFAGFAAFIILRRSPHRLFMAEAGYLSF